MIRHSLAVLLLVPSLSVSALTVNLGKIRIDLEPPEELDGIAEFAWTATGPGTYRLGLADGESAVVASTILGRWEVTVRGRDRETRIADAADVEAAVLGKEWAISP